MCERDDKLFALHKLLETLLLKSSMAGKCKGSTNITLCQYSLQ